MTVFRLERWFIRLHFMTYNTLEDVRDCGLDGSVATLGRILVTSTMLYLVSILTAHDSTTRLLNAC